MSIFKAIGRLIGAKPKNISATCEPIEIEGNFNGDLINGRQVLVSSTGSLKGNITATCLEIYGTATGNIQVDNLLIGSSGKLYYYNLSYNDLQIEKGGVMGQATGQKKEAGGGGKKDSK